MLTAPDKMQCVSTLFGITSPRLVGLGSKPVWVNDCNSRRGRQTSLWCLWFGRIHMKRMKAERKRSYGTDNEKPRGKKRWREILIEQQREGREYKKEEGAPTLKSQGKTCFRRVAFGKGHKVIKQWMMKAMERWRTMMSWIRKEFVLSVFMSFFVYLLLYFVKWYQIGNRPKALF